MKSNFVLKIAALAVAGGVSLSATSALASPGDSFNRPALGASWTITAGSLSISNRQLVGTTGSLGLFNGANSNTAASAVVFLGGTDLEYGAVALGNIGAGNNAFVKIQAQNGAGSFDHAAFYTGNNGAGTFFTLASPVPSPAILDAFFCGTTAVMRITSAAGIQTYSHNYGTTFGAGGGLGTFGSVKLDNFVAFNGNARCTTAASADRQSDQDGPEDPIPASEMQGDKDLSLK